MRDPVWILAGGSRYRAKICIHCIECCIQSSESTMMRELQLCWSFASEASKKDTNNNSGSDWMGSLNRITRFVPLSQHLLQLMTSCSYFFFIDKDHLTNDMYSK